MLVATPRSNGLHGHHDIREQRAWKMEDDRAVGYPLLSPHHPTNNIIETKPLLDLFYSHKYFTSTTISNRKHG
jgi:hypothetical protein